MPDKRGSGKRKRSTSAATGSTDDRAALRARIAELEALEADRERALTIQDALYRIADAASGVHDMAEFYPAIHRIVGELMDADNFYIALYDDEHQTMDYPYAVDSVDVDFPAPGSWEPIGTGQARGTTAYVLRTGRPAHLTLERWEALIAEGEIDRLGAPAEDWLGVPLVAEGKRLGALVVQTYEPEQRYSDADVDLLAFVGQHVATALSRVRAIEETRQRNAELAVINSVQGGLAAELDMQAMYDLVGDKIAEIFDTQVVDIGIYDAEADLLHFPYTIERGVRFPDQPVTPFGFRRHVLGSGEPLLIDDFERQAAEYENPSAPLQGEPAKSLVFAPLISGGRSIGVISLQNLDRAHAFGRAELELLATLTTSLSVALENARLLDQTRQRNAELAVINSVQAGLAAELDMQAMYDLVGDKIAEIFDTHVVDIATYDPDADLLHFPYTIERGVRFPDESVVPYGFRRHVLRTAEPLLIDDVDRQAVEYDNPLTPLSGEMPKTAAFAPLISGGVVTGMISLQNLDREHAFGRPELELLNTLAASLSVALENARLIDETRRRAAELAIINEIGTALAGELEMEAMYELVGERLRDLFQVRDLMITTFDRQTNLITSAYELEEGVRQHTEPFPYGTGLNAIVIRTGKPLRIATSTEADALGAIWIGSRSESWLGVPMVGADGVFGVISIWGMAPNAFNETDERLLGTLASSLSVALESARLFDETRRLLAETDQRAAELAIVNSVGQALASHLDLDALIAQLGDQLVSTFGADLVYVGLHDTETDLIEFPYYYEGGSTAPQAPLPFGQGLTSRILQTREPLLLNQAAQFEAIGTRGVGTAASSYLGVPITVGDTAIGVISVQSLHEVGRFGESDTRLLTTLAANVGVAIQNARLFRAQAEGERQYRRLVEELPLVLYTDKPDATSTAIYISPQVETMFGYPQASWFDPPFFASIVHPDDRERVMSQTQANVDEPDATQSFEYRVIAADGRVVWVHDDVWVVRDESGEPLHVQGFMMDVTEQTLAAAEIRRQKQYFESLVEISPVAVVTMDRGEIVSGWNPAATRLFGYEPDEAIGRHVDDLLFPAEGREEGRAATRQAAETGLAQLIGRRFRKDGQPVDVEIVSVPLVIDDEHTGYYAIYHDISELQAARAAAEDANQAKSTFLAAMSHEIRTPMNAIIGMSGLLLDTPLSDEQRDYAETITTSGEALLTIINDILDFSKIEAGKIDLESSPFALGACVEGALDMIAPLAAAKGVELAYAIDPDLPAVVVGDGGRLRQIVLNLLSNAAKFTDRGEIVLRVGGRRLDRRASAAGPGRWEITIEVRDTGIGIPAERMDRLFRSFSQGDLSISRRYGGTGLGLAISRRLAELMDGSLVAESTGIDGEGSLFRVAIRVDAASELDLAPDRAGPLPELVGRKVLVVDDNATNRQILVAQTGRWGIDSRDTASPHEALGWVESGETFDVALLDLNMPELDGYTLADRIHASATGAATPIVILSSVGSRDRDAPSVAAFLTKPVKPSALHDTLMTVLHGVDKAPAVRLSERPTADPELGRRHPLKILLAEDNAVNQKLAIRLLAQMGYDADIAGNGLEAIAALERTRYDVILMDVQMPELDGLGATRRIRSGDGDRRDVRIVAMTANALAGDREACLEAGMNDYVSKPIRPAELAAALAATPTASSSGGTNDA